MTALAARLTAPPTSRVSAEDAGITPLTERCLPVTGVPGNDKPHTVYPPSPPENHTTTATIRRTRRRRNNTQQPRRFGGERAAAGSKVIKGQSGAVMDVLCLGGLTRLRQRFAEGKRGENNKELRVCR